MTHPHPHVQIPPYVYKEIRVSLDLTQAELAKILGVHRVTIAKRETGALPISAEACYALEYIYKNRKKIEPNAKQHSQTP